MRYLTRGFYSPTRCLPGFQRRAQRIKPLRHKLPACLIGMEACGTATHWARELTGLGHTVRLIPPAYAKAYVRRNKNDPADARAICEAVSQIRFRWMVLVMT